MEIIKTTLSDCYILKPRIYEDSRGYFYEAFNEKEFKNLTGLGFNTVQCNASQSKKGVLRGMHFQTDEFEQAKIVRVTSGRIYDVAVDLRKESPTFLKWFGVELNTKNNYQLFIPRGFAHGFLALENDTRIQYMVDNYYSKKHENGFIWNDPQVSIDWPDTKGEFIISDKDQELKNI